MSQKRLFRIDGQVEWMFWFDTPGDQWLAVCPALNLNAYGSTYQDMVNCMHEAAQLLWEDLLEEGDFEQFLQEQGWTFTAVQEYYSREGKRVDLPYTLRRRGVGEEIYA